MAISVGLTVPATLITSKKEHLLKFQKKYENKKIVNKCASNTEFLMINGKRLAAFTYRLSTEDVDQLPEEFGSSLFQIAVEKDFDIKTFYLNGVFYTQATFSSNSEYIDVRISTKKKRNRVTNFKLPEGLEFKLDALMKKLSLNIGTIDLIKDIDGTFYFLEINPSGQFDYISLLGNFHLDKLIAEHIISKTNEKN